MPNWLNFWSLRDIEKVSWRWFSCVTLTGIFWMLGESRTILVDSFSNRFQAFGLLSDALRCFCSASIHSISSHHQLLKRSFGTTGCFGMLWDVLGLGRPRQDHLRLENPRWIFWNWQWSISSFKDGDFLGSSGILWDALGFSGLRQDNLKLSITSDG